MTSASSFGIRDSEFEIHSESRLSSRISCLLCFIFSGVLPILPAFAVQQPIKEEVVVTANAYPVPFENLSKTVAVFTREDIESLPARTIEDILAQAESVDIRSRSAFGMQADFSIRGSAFSQVLVLVDGMRINDSQTSHHNSDFPVPLQEIDRIEVLLGPGSSVYGADASGGIINVITRRQQEHVQSFFSAGQNGFVEGGFSAGLGKGNIRHLFSVSANRSSGFEYDRDFRSVTASVRTNIGQNTSFHLSYANKEFGANGFYGPAPSKEWTNQTLVSLDRKFEHGSDRTVVLQAYYRTHGDRFLYDIRIPGLFESHHRSHAAVLAAKVRMKTADVGQLTLGGESGGDWISSNTLGQHAFARISLFGEFQWTLGDAVTLYPGLRYDYYSNFGSAVNPSISGSWWIMPRLRLRSSAGRAFRIPTFTELYYRDPNHEASSALRPETAWAEEIGADFFPARQWTASFSLFARQEQNVIDWIRTSANEKWRTANIRNLSTVGAEISLERSLGSKARIATRYSRISVNPEQIDYVSKYVLDYARDSWSASASIAIWFGFAYGQTASYKRRANGRSYWVLDGRLDRGFSKFVIALDMTNMLDEQYQEITGVDMPGRWFALSIRTK